MTISLVQGAKTVTLDDGTDLIGYVTHDSDLASFHLTENNDGVNVLRVVGSGVTLTTIATVYWYDRYMGI
jgi:molybdate-binding protein